MRIITLMIVLLLAIMPTVVAHNIDPLWENTMGPGNQGEKAFAATGDPWDLAVAADFWDIRLRQQESMVCPFTSIVIAMDHGEFLFLTMALQVIRAGLIL